MVRPRHGEDLNLMATVTDQIITDETAFLEVTYDDVTFDLIQVRAVVTASIVLRIWRRNGTNFRDVVVQPGEFVMNFPAGPIRNLADLGSFGMVVT